MKLSFSEISYDDVSSRHPREMPQFVGTIDEWLRREAVSPVREDGVELDLCGKRPSFAAIQVAER